MSEVIDIASLTPELLAEKLSGPPDQVYATLNALAALGSPDAQALVGQMLLDGNGVAANSQLGLGWFRRAAAGGHAMAHNMVGRCYENGWGVEPDPVEAADWYRRAAEMGLDWGMYNYASHLAMGKGVTMNRAEAFAWFNRAADLGHAKSHNIVGGYYEDGWETTPDRTEARRRYATAAAGGDFRGQFNLARFLADEGAMDEAVAMFRNAAETATPAFKAKMRNFLAASKAPALRDLAVALA